MVAVELDSDDEPARVVLPLEVVGSEGGGMNGSILAA